MVQPRIYEASDYAGIVTADYEFYYGYEEIYCPKHSKDKLLSCTDHAEIDDNCDTEEWCFVAKKNGNVIAWYPESKLKNLVEIPDQMSHYLMAGMALFLEEKKL